MSRSIEISLLLILTASPVLAQWQPDTGIIHNERWRTGVPLGGIGCGKVEILTDGSLAHFTGNHNWDRPTGWLKGAFFAVQARWGAQRAARLLRLRTGSDEYDGVENIRETDYVGWFPTATVRFADPDLPLKIALEAFSPLVPHDVESSSLPVALFSFTLQNTGTSEVQASALVSWPNLLGYGGRAGRPFDSRRGNRQEAWSDKPLSGLRFTTSQSYDDDRQNAVGEYVLAALADSATVVSACPTWDAARRTPEFWPEFLERGRLGPSSVLVVSPEDPAGAIAATSSLLPGRQHTIRFVLSWRLPTHRTGKRELRPTGRFVTRSEDLASAIDSEPKTRWTTGRAMQPGDRVEIRFDGEAPRTPTRLVLDFEGSPNDFPRGYRVEGTRDGTAWTTLVESDESAARSAISGGRLAISLPGAETRALRLTQTGRDGFYWWSLHGIEVADASGPIALASNQLSAEIAETEEHAAWADEGHFYANRFASAGSIARHALLERDRLLRDTREWQSLIEASNLPMWLEQKLVNDAFTMFSNTVLTKDGRFSVLESPIDMGGALGTMDQRMAAHALYTQLFTELDRTELELFAKAQREDGRITHFVGNVHETIGDPDVSYGITDWPDLSCSWVLQVLKLYRWTGDRGFLDSMWPHVKRAMAFLEAADTDGDAIPEGGSTYDYETLPRGAFVYSASCTLGALLAAREMARVEEDDAQAKAYAARFSRVQTSVIDRLWNGSFLMKWRSGKDNEEPRIVPNSFVAALAGDWLARLCGLPRTLPPELLDQEMRELIARHVNPFYPVPPMEVTPSGKLATTSCFLLQHEPYLGCEAIYLGYTDQGLDVLRRVHDVSWLLNESPWDQSLVYDAPQGTQGGLVTYMTCPASWHVLNALAGATVDLATGTLHLSPRLPSALRELRLPLFFPTFWAVLEFVPEKQWLALRITKSFSDGQHALRFVARDGDSPPIPLETSFALEAGGTLDLSGFIRDLAPDLASRRVDAVVSAKAARRGIPSDAWSGSASATPSTLPAVMLPPLAFDGQELTRWSTGRPVREGDWFTIDLGRESTIGEVALDFRAHPDEFPRGYRLEVWSDGREGRVLAEADESAVRGAIEGGTLRIEFEPTRARRLRLTSTGSSADHGWSIDEVYVLPPAAR